MGGRRVARSGAFGPPAEATGKTTGIATGKVTGKTSGETTGKRQGKRQGNAERRSKRQRKRRRAPGRTPAQTAEATCGLRRLPEIQIHETRRRRHEWTVLAAAGEERHEFAYRRVEDRAAGDPYELRDPLRAVLERRPRARAGRDDVDRVRRRRFSIWRDGHAASDAPALQILA